MVVDKKTFTLKKIPLISVTEEEEEEEEKKPKRKVLFVLNFSIFHLG